MDKQQCYRVAPRWKLILLILVSSLSFRLYDWRFYLINLSITLALSWLMHISYHQLCKPIGTCFYLLILSFLMHIFWGEWIDGIKVVLRACNIILFASWILLTTSYLDIIEGLTTLLNPLAYVGIKPAKVSLAVALAIRFMPVIHNTFKEIKMAQKARGIDKNFIAILIPALIKTIKMADDIAAAITARSWE
ncbi:MAG: energy-coupling factor transporter transmembrane protein EcfT [Candidatus Cardinium sp.]|uniref:energy-coupling factor transporter transmembrane component T family protein n=1 Tax=Candidatus Cardinium sp. TP TaxID=2961955 RepID=UPI0021B066B5|nr:energy-coupling factor transporter transmembrane protein EcfT [Candidatus Cardinium sp. TP]MCT4697096.1 energy-coupling factor transporter transmembrane protein EcfT [Candidatus Cardinium sp. TP]MDN5247027.1 energy-coupling factor transporter transmembrane protein EcfT [Candidatus Cardinium sp.]